MSDYALSSVIRLALSSLAAPSLGTETPRIACLNAHMDEALSAIAKDQDWLCEQGFYPDYIDLKSQGLRVEPSLNEDDYALVILMAPRAHQWAMAELARAVTLVRPGHPVLIAAPNQSGGRRLEDDCLSLGLKPLSFAKSKCRAVIAYLDQGLNQVAVQKAFDLAKPKQVTPKSVSRIGLFAGDRLDQGTLLLLTKLDQYFSANPKLMPKGHVCDLGSGWGPIIDHLLSAYDQIVTMTGIEAEYAAVNLARSNLKPHGERVQILWGMRESQIYHQWIWWFPIRPFIRIDKQGPVWGLNSSKRRLRF